MAVLKVEFPAELDQPEIRYRAEDGAVSIPTASGTVVILYYDGGALVSDFDLGTERDPEFQPLPKGARIIITV